MKTGLRGEEDCEPATSSSKAGKRKRSSSLKEISGPSSTTPSPVTSRSDWMKNRDETKEDDYVKKIKVEGSLTTATPNTSREKVEKGTCPICNKSMKFSVLERHAGERLMLCCGSETVISFQLIVRVRQSPGGPSPVSTNGHTSLAVLIAVPRDPYPYLYYNVVLSIF